MSMYDQVYGLDRPVKVRGCDCPGCAFPGDYRAPRDKSLNGYYFFCLEHVREYNRNWDYFAGMSGGEIERYIRGATVWERPSWPLGSQRAYEQMLRRKVDREFFVDDPLPSTAPTLPKATHEALVALDLQPPVDFVIIKTRYRELVKKYHPDVNGGDRETEEKFKSINLAFATLKRFYSEEAA